MPEHAPVVTGQNDARYSILAFCNRSDTSQQQGRTRFHEETLSYEKPIGRNSVFERDIIKIKQSPEWRRLQGIYQFAVPLHEEQRHKYQNRITHTEDVQDVGATIARRLMLDRDSIDLVRCIAAIHDMGHMPFTHWGEEVAVKKLKSYGRPWKHDAAGLRVVAEWSNDGLTYPGLNLTMDTLEGLTKRYWHYRPQEKLDHFNHDLRELPECIRHIDKEKGLYLDKHNHIEGQIAAIADWIAFTATDIEDGLSSGWMTLKEVTDRFPPAKKLMDGFTEEMRRYYQQPDVAPLQRDNKKRQEALNKKFANHIREMLIHDVVEQTNANTLDAFGRGAAGTPCYAEEVRDMDKLLVGFSPEILKEMVAFQGFCVKMIHPRMIEQVGPVPQMVEKVIDDFVDGKLVLSESWEKRRKALFQSGKPLLDVKGDITELACEFLVRESTDAEVISYIQKEHPKFWQENFVDRHIPKASGHASRHNALQKTADASYFR